MKMPELVGNAEEYKVVCGVCGHKYTQKPLACIACGSDAEFEEIVIDRHEYMEAVV